MAHGQAVGTGPSTVRDLERASGLGRARASLSRPAPLPSEPLGRRSFPDGDGERPASRLERKAFEPPLPRHVSEAKRRRCGGSRFSLRLRRRPRRARPLRDGRRSRGRLEPRGTPLPRAAQARRLLGSGPPRSSRVRAGGREARARAVSPRGPATGLLLRSRGPRPRNSLRERALAHETRGHEVALVAALEPDRRRVRVGPLERWRKRRFVRAPQI